MIRGFWTGELRVEGLRSLRWFKGLGFRAELEDPKTLPAVSSNLFTHS